MLLVPGKRPPSRKTAMLDGAPESAVVFADLAVANWRVTSMKARAQDLSSEQTTLSNNGSTAHLRRW
eukprot:15145109-Alexandrium_andersonii.AAC.1